MNEQIVAGDWVVAGSDVEGLDCGMIRELDGDRAFVGWSGGTADWIDLSEGDVDVYGSKAAAEKAYHAKREELAAKAQAGRAERDEVRAARERA